MKCDLFGLLLASIHRNDLVIFVFLFFNDAVWELAFEAADGCDDDLRFSLLPLHKTTSLLGSLKSKWSVPFALPLELVKTQVRYPFIYPMLAFVAYTGVRRSEMIRVTIDDFDLENGTVLIRERKRSRLRSTTFRRVGQRKGDGGRFVFALLVNCRFSITGEL